MKRLFSSALTFVLLLPCAFAQDRQPETKKYTHAQIDTLIQRSAQLTKKDAAKGLITLNDLELICERIGYNKGLAAVYCAEAAVFSDRFYYKNADSLYDRAIKLSRISHDDYQVALAEEHISILKRREGKLEDAVRMLNGAEKILRGQHQWRDHIDVLLRLGLIKAMQNKYSEAQSIFWQSYSESKRTGYLYGEKKSYYNKAELFSHIRQADSAVYYYNRALRIDTLTHDDYGKALSYNGLSKVYLDQGKFKPAVWYGNLAQQHAANAHELDLLSYSANVLLDVFRKAGDKDKTVEWQDKVLKVDQQIHERDKKDAIAFIDILKDQHQKQLKDQQELANVQKESELKNIFIICAIIMIGFATALLIPLNRSYKKARQYAAELQFKNGEVEMHMAEVKMLNAQVTGQNVKLDADNKLKDKLLSVISHDLRHPLANTKSILDLINLKLVSPEETDNLFKQLEAQYVRSLTLLDNLLYWIKGQVEGTEALRSDVNLNEVIDMMSEEQRLALVKKDITVVNAIDAELSWHAERESVRIIFRNLLSNAVKFSHRGGVISFLSSVNDDGTAAVTVKDEGVGISKEVLERLTREINYTSKGTANEEGSGLGLMLIRGLIRKYDGRLEVRSEPGAGTEFIVRFQATIAESLQNQPV